MKPEIWMIIGYLRSGSTVLREFINQAEEVVHVGELERLWYLRNKPVPQIPAFRFIRGKVKLAEDERWKVELRKKDKQILRKLDFFIPIKYY